jgi:16S rRNA (cytosine967-C5)-methyltransferase
VLESVAIAGRFAAMISPARLLAYETIRATFEQDAHTERAFRRAADVRRIGGRERAQAQRLAYGAVQRRGTIDAALSRLVDRSLRDLDPEVLAALRLGMYELLFSDGTPDHAAVDQAVELAKRAGAAHASGLVNAVLRRAIRERQGLAESLLGDDSTPEGAAVAHSAPLWLARMWWSELGPEPARSLLAACNEPAEHAFRVSTLSTDRDTVLAKLRDAGIDASPVASGAPYPPMAGEKRTGSEFALAAPETIVISGRTGGAVPELVMAGELTPQSRGSAAVVELLDPRPGEHVLDLCAGPGIKTGQIAARMGDRGEVISVESDPERAKEVAEQARRLGLRSVTVIEADAGAAGMAQGFDRVLVDPPCSDLGALASRPDARWRKSPKAIERLVEEQALLLRRGLEALRPGGTLVYSTCTISRRENEDRVAALIAAAEAGEVPALTVDDLGALAPGLASPVDPRCLQIRPDRDCTTGFFICRLSRDDGRDE